MTTNTASSETGVIIARFQSPYLHEGHKALIDEVSAKHDKIVVVLGISPVLGSVKNPFDFATREKMIKAAYPNLMVLPLSDHPLDAKWSANLDTLLSQTFPRTSFLLYGSRDCFIPYYTGKNKTFALEPHGQFNATEIRKSFSQKVMDAEEFRAGIIYAYANTYPKVYPTVDVALFRNNRSEVLMGRKDIDNKWRLLGGFSDPEDESFEAAALRELREECGPVETTPMQYETSFRVNDWRYRNERDKIITTLFSADYVSGETVGSDDIAEVKWILLQQVREMMEQGIVAKEHMVHFNFLLKKY